MTAKKILSGDDLFPLLNSFPIIIYTPVGSGKIVYSNGLFRSLLGHTKAGMEATAVRGICSALSAKTLLVNSACLLPTARRPTEIALLAKNGDPTPVEALLFDAAGAGGRKLRVLAVLRKSVEALSKQIELINAGRLAAIGQIASGVAHDIHNPLTAILLSNEVIMRLLQSGRDPGERNLEAVLICAEEVSRAARTIRKLADHLRDFASGLAEHYEPVDIFACVENALFIARGKLRKSRVRLVNKMKPGTHVVHGCPTLLEQVFVNLFSNACDAMTSRRIRTLTLSAARCKRDGRAHWRCDVADTGRGIPHDSIDRVFETFYTTKRRGHGTGLGLSITRGILRNHQGEIEVASCPEGTTFSIFLPCLERNKA